MLRPTVEPWANLTLRRDVEPELGGDDNLIADRSERVADHLLAEERPVDFGGIKKSDASVMGGPDHPNRLLPAERLIVHPCYFYAAEAKGRDLQPSELPRFHRVALSDGTVQLLRASG